MSDQLPITLNESQLQPLYEILEVAIQGQCDTIDIAQSRGPVLEHAVFVWVYGWPGHEVDGKKFVIDYHGNKSVMPAEREPSDRQVMDPVAPEPGMDEHDWRL